MQIAVAALQLPDGFWPTTATGWIAVAVFAASVLAGIWRFAKVANELNGFGLRLNKHDARAEAIEARMANAEQDAKFAALDRTNLHESITRLAVQMQTLVSVTQSSAVQRVEELSEIRERLVRIETKVDENRRE